MPSNTGGENILFCFVFFVQSTTNHCVSFGCSVSGFHHAECSSGGPKSSTACFLFLRRPPPVYMEAFNLLVYRTLSTKPQKSYFSKKKIKINKPKKKKKDHRLVVHHQKCKTRKINYLDDKKNGENLLFFFFLFF